MKAVMLYKTFSIPLKGFERSFFHTTASGYVPATQNYELYRQIISLRNVPKNILQMNRKNWTAKNYICI